MSIDIEKHSSPDLIPFELRPAISDMTDLYLETFGERLESVYLLGGPTRGEYRPGISDFDMRAIVVSQVDGEKERVDKEAVGIQQRHNLGNLELDVYSIDMLNQRDWLQFYILVDGLPVWGKSYVGTFPLPASKEELAKMLSRHLFAHYHKIPDALAQARVYGIRDPEIWKTSAKRALRIANLVTILKTGTYTQNSDRMVENILLNVPEVAESVNLLNRFRINPPTNLEEYEQIAMHAEIVRQAVLRYDELANTEEE